MKNEKEPGHISRAKDPAIVEESQKIFGITTKVLWTVSILIVVFVALSSLKECSKKATDRGAETLTKITAAPPTTASRTQKPNYKEVWKTFEIPPQGLKIHLKEVWRDIAIGGNITIVTPKGQLLRDEPGANHNYGAQPDGIYTFMADPPGAKRQVQITTQW